MTAQTRSRSRTSATTRKPPAGRAGAQTRRRRRIAAVVAAAILGAGVAAVVAGVGPLGDAVREITLPLRHEDIIRQQAADKDLDPALIAAVIYEESRFRDQTSHAGARGLMQVTPATADFIAQRSGGTAFTSEDLATPQVNISYGAYYLRYLLDRYGDDQTLAIAAYNAGEGQLDRWVEEVGGTDDFDASEDIPFPETHAYVENVEERQKEYRKNYADELGL
ncbi:MAG: lytic transglycosylase domain-containing protein [Actinomycetota bacterium]|nr:lytic transglycosylase domain-containing protein [Actinomycetota bacterium]